MTFDIIALCREQPGPEAAISAMVAAGPDLRVNAIEEAELVQLHHADGRLMLTTEGARLVQVAGETGRLLGIDSDVPHPVWWVEVRAPGHDLEAEAVARRFIQAMLAETGGMLWSNR